MDFSKKVYSDLRKHDFSRLLPISIYHQEQIMKTMTVINLTTQRGKTDDTEERKDRGTNAHF